MKKTFFFSLLVLLMTACNFSSTITVLPGTKEFPKEGGEFTITVTTDNDQREWIAECDSAWIHLDKTAGIGGDKVEVTVDANPYATTQSATIHFRCESNSVHVIVLRAGTGSSSSEGKPSQNPNAPIQVDVTEIEAPAEGGEYDVQVMAASDLKWMVSSNASWVSYNIGVEKGNKTIKLTIAPAAKDVYDKMEAVVTLKPQASTSDDDKTYIYVTRKGNPAPVFTIFNNKKVMFAPGNLQYSAAWKEWRFAQHQYTVIGADNKYISATNYDYIDLFGWGTSGYNDCYPYLSEEDDSKYGLANVDIEGTEYDWGIFNSANITNSPNKEYKWFTLSSVDWNTILEKNVTTLGKLNGVEGLFVYPDGMAVTGKETFDDYTTYTAEESWVTENGVLFLPSAGFRVGTTYCPEMTLMGRVGEVGLSDYWTSTVDGVLEFSSKEGEVTTVGYPSGKCVGLPVRLAREVEQ